MSECSTLGQRLKEARVAAGLSLSALGRLIGVRHSTIFRWENEQHDIPVSKAFSLCSVLRILLAWLVFGPEGPSPQAGVSTPDQPLDRYREVNYV